MKTVKVILENVKDNEEIKKLRRDYEALQRVNELQRKGNQEMLEAISDYVKQISTFKEYIKIKKGRDEKV